MKLTISIVAAIHHKECINAIKSTIINSPPISKVYWVSDVPIIEDVGVPVDYVRVKPYVRGTSLDLWYNNIALRLLPAIVDCDFNLVLQSDGYAVNKNAWTDEFLNYDYIGAVWPHMISGQNVGNGGFSLRSRKLYDALIDWNPSYMGADWPGLTDPHYHILPDGSLILPEDACIASPYRPTLENVYNIKYATENIAYRFSLETPPCKIMIGSSFGFHGRYMAEQLGQQTVDKLH